MEVFQTDNYYIFVKREKSLWWNRNTSEFTIKSGWDLSSVDDIECIGITLGIVGLVVLANIFGPHLLVVREATPVGELYPNHLVYKIKSVCILSADEPDSALTPCTRHMRSKCLETPQSTAKDKNNKSAPSHKVRLFEKSQLVNKTWGAVKSAGMTIRNTTQQAAVLASNQVKTTVGIRDATRHEKRISEELHKIFDYTDSFYFCVDFDITNNLQRHLQQVANNEPQRPDERFFWNSYMIRDITALNDPNWILPIIQGFVQVEPNVISGDCFSLALISRRSRYRAGTRYKRRGVDESGNCANYVETEQILSFRHHQLSFTQVRGSVPIYWSQPGYKYRPPPILDRGEDESQEAFEMHFAKEFSIYDKVCIVNLVEHHGKEKIIGDAFAKHVVKFNNENLIYVTFDFHDYCRGMKFENVSTLVEVLMPETNAMGFHWRDQHGVICNQKSVFRVNCMDCLDRTNIVQTALGRAVLESQLVKLGLLAPYTGIPEQLKSSFMVLWANNGDVISRQYAGTNALKGDYTRTGERKISGLMKDGMNSANRYYLARFKDTYRQATIDLMLGNEVSIESLSALGGQTALQENDNTEGAEHAKQLVEECRKMLLGASQYPIGAWGLINADPVFGDINETEVDYILLLTDNCYIVAEYSSLVDKIVRFEKVFLDKVYLIELGIQKNCKYSQNTYTDAMCLRINYEENGVKNYYHTFRSANIRFFNNMVYIIKSAEEINESLHSIVDMFRIALETAGNKRVEYCLGRALARRIRNVSLLDVPTGMPRNLSESQLVQMSAKTATNITMKDWCKSSPAGTITKGSSAQFTNNDGANNEQQGSSKEKPRFILNDKEDEGSRISGSGSEECFESTRHLEADNNSEYAKMNNFLPSVGIVMGNEEEAILKSNVKDDGIELIHVMDMNKLNISKHDRDVPEISRDPSIATPVTSATPNPQICLTSYDSIIPDSIHLGGSASNEYFRVMDELQLSPISSKKITKPGKPTAKPFSDIVKGVQNFGFHFDSILISPKSGILSPSSTSSCDEDSTDLKNYRSENRNYLEEQWSIHKCKSKLIAL